MYPEGAEVPKGCGDEANENEESEEEQRRKRLRPIVHDHHAHSPFPALKRVAADDYQAVYEVLVRDESECLLSTDSCHYGVFAAPRGKSVHERFTGSEGLPP